MNFSSRVKDDILEVVAEAKLDASTSSEFKQFCQVCLDADEETILFNLLKVDFLDSSGISSLVTLHRRLKKAGKESAIVYDNPQIEEVFIMTKLNRLFTLYQDLEEAYEEMA